MFLIFAVTVSFVILVYIVYSILEAVWFRRSRVRRRAESLTDAGAPQPERPEPRTAESEGGAFPTIASVISARGFADRLFLMLLKAGVKLRPSEFIGVVSGGAVLLALLAAIFANTIGSVVLASAIGMAMPFVYIKVLQARRLAAFNRQLPDALSLIGSAIRSGYSFTRTMQMVVDEMTGPIAEEFQRVLNECSVGLPMEASLRRMVSRVGSYDLELVVTAVSIQQQIGGNLAEIVDNIGETIRDRIRVEGELAALTADGRISGVVLIILPILLAGFILMINPRYLEPLITEPIGKIMVIGGLSLQAIGAIVIRRMLVLDY